MIKKLSLGILLFIFLLTGCTEVKENVDSNSSENNKDTSLSISDDNLISSEEEDLLNNNEEIKEEDEFKKMYIEVGNESYRVSLYDNKTTKSLITLLPMTVTMKDLNGNEKYYYLNQNLPSENKAVNYIEAGEILLFGSNCLVIFYESFPTTYQYTKIGYIEDFKSIGNDLGNEDIEITFKTEI